MQLLIHCLWLLCLGTPCLTLPLEDQGADSSDLSTLEILSPLSECSMCPLSSCDDGMYGDCEPEDADDPNDPNTTLQLLSGRNEHDASALNLAFGGSRKYGVGIPAGDCSFKIKSRGYPWSGKLFGMTKKSDIDKVLRLQSQCCFDTNIELLDKSLFSKQDISKHYSTEHIEELQFAVSLLQSLASGFLPSGAPMKTPKIPCHHLKAAFTAISKMTIGPWVLQGSAKILDKPADLLFEAFGSATLTKPLVLLENGVNARKSKCFSYNKQIGRNEDKFLQVIRETIGAWQYIHQKDVAIQTANTRGRLSQVNKYFGQEVQALVDMREAFREIEPDWWKHAATHCKDQVIYLIGLVEDYYEESIANGVVPANWPNVERALKQFKGDMLTVLHPPPPPSDF